MFPHQRSLDESGRAGLEEERRLAYVGVTRARRRVKILFASNRRIHGLWQTTVPVALHRRSAARCMCNWSMTRSSGGNYGAYAQSRFANMDSLRLALRHAGLETGAAARGRDPGTLARPAARKPSRASLLASSTAAGKFAPGVRIFHIKFGPGTVAAVDGAKLTIDFDKAGRKLVLESFVERRD